MMTLSQFMSLSLSFVFARHIHLVFALAVAAAAKDAAHDDEEGGETGEEQDGDEEALWRMRCQERDFSHDDFDDEKIGRVTESL